MGVCKGLGWGQVVEQRERESQVLAGESQGSRAQALQRLEREAGRRFIGRGKRYVCKV